MSDLDKTFLTNAERLAVLGSWQEGAAERLLDRIPDPNSGQPAPGMDAGLACAMNIVPQCKWPLLAVLHARPTPEAVEQVRREIADGLDTDSETCWWLTACSVCYEGNVTWSDFLDQVAEMRRLAKNPFARHTAAEAQWVRMEGSFELKMLDGIPYGDRDGCQQAAYLAGHSVAVLWAEAYGIFFVGTYEESLGLEGFDWSDEVDEQGRPKSGPVGEGSRQFVKCASRDELNRALTVVREKFGL